MTITAKSLSTHTRVEPEKQAPDYSLLPLTAEQYMYEGAIIKETLSNELLLDHLTIDKVEIWKTNDANIKYWTMIFFIPKLTKYEIGNVQKKKRF